MQFQKSNESTPEKVWMTRYNNTANALIAGQVIEFVASAVAGTAGLEVRGINAAVNLTTGVAAELAGVATAAIAATTRFTAQVYGPCTVRANTTLTAGQAAVASSVNATSFAADASQSTAVSAEYAHALLGVTLGVTNATNSIVQLRLL